MSEKDETERKNSTRSFKWKTHPRSLRTNRGWCCVNAIDDTRLIISGGFGHGTLKSVELFNIKEIGVRARFLASMYDKRESHISIIHSNYLYVIGGYDGEDYLNSVERLNIINFSNSEWEMLAPMNELRHSFAAAKDYGYIYVFGGGDDGFSAERYNISHNKWEHISPMKQIRIYHAAVSIEEKIYVFGGKNEDEYLSSMEIYDTKLQTWENGTGVDMPISLAYMTAVVVNDQIIVLGGTKKHDDTIFINEDVLIFNIRKQTWRTIYEATTKLSREGFATAVLKESAIFVIGGKDENGQYLKTVEHLNINEIQLNSSKKGSKRSSQQLNETKKQSRKISYHENNKTNRKQSKEIQQPSIDNAKDGNKLERSKIQSTENENFASPSKLNEEMPVESRIQSDEIVEQSLHDGNKLYVQNANTIKVEGVTGYNGISLPSAGSARLTPVPPTNHNLTPIYASPKTALERVAFLEESVGLKNNSTVLPRRIAMLETTIFGEISSNREAIVQRIEKLEIEFFSAFSSN